MEKIASNPVVSVAVMVFSALKKTHQQNYQGIVPGFSGGFCSCVFCLERFPETGSKKNSVFAFSPVFSASQKGDSVV